MQVQLTSAQYLCPFKVVREMRFRPTGEGGRVHRQVFGGAADAGEFAAAAGRISAATGERDTYGLTPFAK